jgi:hypothetical protein
MTKRDWCDQHGRAIAECAPKDADCYAVERPLWDEHGPTVGEVITIAGTSMQTRWTGTHWELVR